MTNPAERYRKLPGHRRGFLRGASLWIGSDHLLSVRSFRVREDYKRFQFRDIQAIVVARCPRFQISTRSCLLGGLWLAVFLLNRSLLPGPAAYTAGLWAIAVALVVAWLYVSIFQSCRCRILTAVSRDELPSVYRSWTARRFLSELEPRITEVQGHLEGKWFESADLLRANPPDPAAQPATTAIRHPRSFPAIVFVALLFAGCATMLLTLHSPVSTVLSVSGFFVLAQLAAIVAMFVQHRHRVLRKRMLGLAIAGVTKIGLGYYAALILMSAISSSSPGMTQSVIFASPPYLILRQVDAWTDLALGLVGAALLLAPEFAA